MPILSWEDVAGSEDGIVNIESGLSYDMGGMTASVSFLDQSDDGSATAYSADDVLFTGEEAFDPDSSLKLLGVGGDGSEADETMTATIDFSANTDSGFIDNVSDVTFRVNDLDLGPDNSDIVTILAYDAAGNLVPVTLTPTATMTQSGNTVTANDTEYYPDEEEASLLVEIEGPVSRIVIEYANGGEGEQRVHVTDIHYSTISIEEDDNIVDGTDGDDVMLVGFVDTDDDTIDGADGDDDTILGYEGDDTIYGGDGVDLIYGGDDDDELFGGSGEDLLEGGQGSDTLDGGAGADELFGGDDDDDLTVGAGDSAVGGFGDDVFFVDADDTDGTEINIDGSDGGEGDPSDTTNDDYPGAPLPVGDVLDLSNLLGGGLITGSGAVTYTSEDNEDGFVILTDGTIVNFEEIENVVVCFTRGTMIVTDKGEKSIEELTVGDKVLTKDNGLQELRWVGSRTVPAMGTFAPIMIKAGAMANDRDLMVSPQHRMVVEGWKAELLFGEREVLAAAKHLVNNDTIYVKEGGDVEYFHILFDTHEIVFANGAESESFHPGEVGISSLSNASRDEVFALFPELRADASSYGLAARTSLKGHEAKVLSENPDFLN